MYVSVCCFNICVAETGRHRFNITAVRKQKRRRSMPEAMKLEMSDSMTFQKMSELFGWGMRVHDMAVFLRENVMQIMPCIPHVRNVPILLVSILY